MLSLRSLLFLLITLLLLNSATVLAQGKDSVAIKDSVRNREKGHFIIGATYNSGMNYYGRVDSLKSSGVYPFIGLSARNGLYLNATFVFIHNSLQSQYAATLLEGGYNFKNKRGNWAGSLSVTKYFYRDNTDLAQSAVKGAAAASITHLNKVINITLGADVKSSDRTDIGGQAGLDHIIRIPDIFGKDVIVLDPSATIYAGTQSFTQTYYQKKNLLFIPVAEEAVTKNSRAFNILAYEFSVPVVYAYKKINLIFSPAYILPQNILSVPGQTGLSERAANLFYITATVKFTL
ncbi:MAG TPA: hypothetical protein VF939_17120 [Puia sp.]